MNRRQGRRRKVNLWRWRRITLFYKRRIESLRAELAALEAAWPEIRRLTNPSAFATEGRALEKRTLCAQQRLIAHLKLSNGG
jgi:hypothetical protein